MAFGKPTIIADEVGPDTESLIHNETGFRYVKGDVNDLVDKVRISLMGSDSVKAITKNAQSEIRERFSIDHMVAKIHQCIIAAV